METIKKIINDLNIFNAELLDLSYLITFSILIGLTYLLIILNTKIFKKLQEKQTEEKALTKLEIKRLQTNQILIGIAIFIIFFIVLMKNFSIFMSILSIMSFMIIMSAKEQVSNIIVGLSMKIPFIKTTMNEGQIIRLKSINNDPFKILKIKLFKTLILDMNTEEIISIQNTDLISQNVYHNPVKEFDIINYEYIICSEQFPVNESKIKEYLMELSKNEVIEFSDLRKMVGYIKYEYEYFPSLKNNLNIKYTFLNSKEIKVEIETKRFNYNYQNYNKEYVLIYKLFNE